MSTSEETETSTTEQVNELTPYYQQKIVDNVSKELVDKICNTLVMDSNNTLTDALIVQTQQSIANMFGKPENTDRFLDVILGGMKKSMQFIKGSSVLLYSILSDPNGYAQYKELLQRSWKRHKHIRLKWIITLIFLRMKRFALFEENQWTCF